MPIATEIVNQLSPVQAAAMVKRINREVSKAIPQDALVPAAGNTPGIDEIASLDPETRVINLESAASQELSRGVLHALASDPATAPLIIQAWEAIRDDDSLFIETVVALGLIANLTLFVATTDVDLKVGGLTIRKRRPKADIVRAVVEPLVELVKKLPLPS
jgi:hypothetical protein